MVIAVISCQFNVLDIKIYRPVAEPELLSECVFYCYNVELEVAKERLLQRDSVHL